MRKGNSIPWPEILETLTDGRTDRINPESILEYFKPLYLWLKKQNLTDTNWDCDNYIDNKRRLVKSYDGVYEHSSASSSSRQSIGIICLILFFYFIVFKTTFA